MPASRTHVLTALAALLAVWAAFVSHLWFVCDDAYISFRYARNWAAGHGLVYNLGEPVPVEGYSNLLWVLLAGLVERVQGDPATVMPLLSAASGAVLLALVVRVAARDLGLGLPGVLVAGATLAWSPAYAAWSSGGLATMPLALCLFALTERLVLADAQRTWPLAATVAVALVLLRTEGPAWVVVVCGVALAARYRQRDDLGAAWASPVLQVLALALGVTVLHVTWRLGTYGDFVSNTARAKVGLGVDRLLRGLKYLASVGLALGTPVLGLAALPVLARVGPKHTALAALGAAVPAYAVAVGGDYMAFARLLVPGLPFLALALGAFVDRSATRGAVVGVLLAVGALPGLGIELAPEPVREALRFRQNVARLDREYASWRFMKQNTQRWLRQGEALALATPPDWKIVTGAIGARGYASDRFLLDRGGLVTAEVNQTDWEPDPLDMSPGHDRIAPRRFFLAWQPEVLEFEVESANLSVADLQRQVDRFQRRAARDGYGPRAVKVVVDRRPYLVLLLQRADSPKQAEAWWDEVATHLAAVRDGPPVQGATPSDPG